MATEKRFQVGVHEKHDVRVINSRATDTAKIFIDGKKIFSKTVITPQIYHLVVGNDEKHDVTITVGGSLSSKIEYYIDIDQGKKALLEKEMRQWKEKTIIVYVVSMCIALIIGFIIGKLFF